MRNAKGEILLVLKSASRTKKYGCVPYWDIPGGRVEEENSVGETLEREMAEETGIERFSNEGLFDAVVSNLGIQEEDCGLILFVYKISPIGHFEIQLDDENAEFGWFDRKKASELLRVKYPQEFVDKLQHLD